METRIWNLARSVVFVAACGGTGPGGAADHGADGTGHDDGPDDDACGMGSCGETNSDVYPEDYCYTDDQCDSGWECIEQTCVERPMLPLCDGDALGAEIPWGQAPTAMVSLAFFAGVPPTMIALGETSVERVVMGDAPVVIDGDSVAIDLVVADLEGDGPPEIITTDGARVLRYDGLAADPAVPPTVLLEMPIDRLFVADANGDGMADVLGRSTDHLSVVVAWAVAPGEFAEVVHITLPQPAVAVGMGDLDGDALPDLAVAMTLGDPWQIGIVDLAGGSTRLLPQRFAELSAVAVGRLDDDAIDDIAVIATRDDATLVTSLLSTADGAVASETSRLGGVYPIAVIGAVGRSGAHAIAFGGRDELRVVEHVAGTPSCYSLVRPGATTAALVVGDVDGDGAPELVRAGGGAVGAFPIAR